MNELASYKSFSEAFNKLTDKEKTDFVAYLMSFNLGIIFDLIECMDKCSCPHKSDLRMFGPSNLLSFLDYVGHLNMQKDNDRITSVDDYIKYFKSIGIKHCDFDSYKKEVKKYGYNIPPLTNENIDQIEDLSLITGLDLPNKTE